LLRCYNNNNYAGQYIAARATITITTQDTTLLHVLRCYNNNNYAGHYIATRATITITTQDTTLLHVLRCYNNKSPDKRDLLLTALSNGAKIPQQTQLYHSRETSQFEYSECGAERLDSSSTVSVGQRD